MFAENTDDVLTLFQRLALIAQVRDRTDRHDSGRLMQRSEKGFWAANGGVAYGIPGVSIPGICKGVRSCMLVVAVVVVSFVVVVVVAFVVLVVPSHIAS